VLVGRRATSFYRSILVSFCCTSPLLLTAARPVVGGGGAAEKYPDWFIRTPVVAGVRMAVGYAPIYLDTAASIREALDFGKAALRVAGAVRVRAEYLQEILPDGNVAYRGEQYAEDTLAAQIDSVVAVDTVFMRRMVLVLVGSSQTPLLQSRLTAIPSKAPKWIAETPPASDGAYAVGVASAHFDEHEAWKEAERQARRSLAFATVTQLRSATESRTGGTSDGALIATTATELHDVQIRERWRDSRRLFVLVHARAVSASGP